MLLPRPLSLLCLLGNLLLALAQDDATSNTRSIQLRTHSLAPPYLDSDMQSRWFDFGGDTIVRVDQYIRLTSDRPSQEGYIFSRVPLTATNWQIEFEFKVHGQGNLHGDGMAMWITKQRAQPGTVFGHADKFEGLGIFIDTYKNNRPGVVFPYVMAMLGDGQTAYDKNNDGKANELAGCSARGIRGASIPTKARLTFFQDNQNLKLELQYKKEGEWTQCFDVNGVNIPNVAYLGFSAETGELSDNHDLISVETRNLYTRNPSEGRPVTGGRAKGKGYDPNKGSKSGGGWGWFFLKIVLFFVFCAVGYVGWTIYRSQRRSSRF